MSLTRQRAEAFLAELTELSNRHDIVIMPDGMEVEGLQLEDISKECGKYELNRFYDSDRYFNWVETK